MCTSVLLSTSPRVFPPENPGGVGQGGGGGVDGADLSLLTADWSNCALGRSLTADLHVGRWYLYLLAFKVQHLLLQSRLHHLDGLQPLSGSERQETWGGGLYLLLPPAAPLTRGLSISTRSRHLLLPSPPA